MTLSSVSLSTFRRSNCDSQTHTFPYRTESEQVEDAEATEKARQKAKEEAKEVRFFPLFSFPFLSPSLAFPFPAFPFPLCSTALSYYRPAPTWPVRIAASARPT